MSLDLKERSQRRMRLMIAVLVGTVVLLAGTIVALATAGGGEADDDNAKPGGGSSAAPEPSESSSKLPDEDGGYTDPDTWVKLPKGKGKENGLPVKFPHTARGAAAMAVAAARNSWTFDADQLKRGSDTYSVKQYRAAMAKQSTASADAIARFAGVPSGRKPSKDASVSAWVIGVDWKQVSSDRIQVFTLARVTTKAGDGADTRTRLQSSPTEVVWEDGDWKAAPTPKSEVPEPPEPAELGSDRFSDEGWKAIQEGDRR